MLKLTIYGLLLYLKFQIVFDIYFHNSVYGGPIFSNFKQFYHAAGWSNYAFVQLLVILRGFLGAPIKASPRQSVPGNIGANRKYPVRDPLVETTYRRNY